MAVSPVVAAAEAAAAPVADFDPKTIELVKDKHTKDRGGKSKLYALFCTHCEGFVGYYQKDGPGKLLRCYHDRFHPPKSPEVMRLVCVCGKVLGSYMNYKNYGKERAALRLIKGVVGKTEVKV